MNAGYTVSKIIEKNLKKKQRFLNNVNKFNIKKLNSDISYEFIKIMDIINKITGEEYVLEDFYFKKDDYYENEIYITFNNGYEDRTERSVLKKGDEKICSVLLTKEAANCLSCFKFNDSKEFQNGLNAYGSGKVFENNVISESKFSENFSYISDFLCELVKWRMENNTLVIPSDVIDKIAESIIFAEIIDKNHER